jgi:hypothetical protein
MNQPEAALYIHEPMLETTVAIQTTVKVLWWNAFQGERDFSGAAAADAGAGGPPSLGGVIVIALRR